jgi:hypothetical protein
MIAGGSVDGLAGVDGFLQVGDLDGRRLGDADEDVAGAVLAVALDRNGEEIAAGRRWRDIGESAVAFMVTTAPEVRSIGEVIGSPLTAVTVRLPPVGS